MNLSDLEQELQRLLRACEGLDDAVVLDAFEVAIEPLRGQVVAKRMEADAERLTAFYARSARARSTETVSGE
jgi:hypothetical protein